MKKISSLLLVIIAINVSCNKPVSKKVIIYGRGKITATANNITMTDGTGFVEEKVDLNDETSVLCNITTPTGKTTVTVPEGKGVYILNLKTDTLVGSQQIIGRDIGNRTISQEELRKNIDSLNRLTTGANVSEAAHNYIILPQQLKKISASLNAQVYGPFTKMSSSIEADKDGKAPDLYKFYTNGEVRDLIGHLKKMTY